MSCGFVTGTCYGCARRSEHQKILLYDFDTQVGLRQIGLVVMVVALGGSKTSDHSDPQKKNQKNELKKFKMYQNQLTFDIIG